MIAKLKIKIIFLCNMHLNRWIIKQIYGSDKINLNKNITYYKIIYLHYDYNAQQIIQIFRLILRLRIIYLHNYR